MNTGNKKKIILAAFALLLLISIPVTIGLLSNRQDPRGRAAAGSTTLSFTPTSTTATPLQKGIGDDIALDMYVDPGSNIVTFVRYQVSFDPTKVQLAATPMQLNNTIFSNVEGPVTSAGSIAQSVSIGSDPTKAIQTKTKIGTLHFTAIGGTGSTPTAITFGNLTQALSAGANDQASQNVLSSTTPALVTIAGTAATPSASTIPQPTITGTAVNFTLLLHGVGTAGDNPNPSGNSLSNKNPLHPQRNLDVQIFDTNNQIVASASAPVTYDSASGTFIGAVGLGNSVTSGNYNIKIRTDRYLRKRVPGIQQIKVNETTQLPSTQMITGDTNNDNVLNVIDYNALLDCGYGELNPLPIADANAVYNTNECKVHVPQVDVDVNDDGIIGSTDYNLFLRELSVQNGD